MQEELFLIGVSHSMSKSRAYIMCHRKSKKRLLVGASHSFFFLGKTMVVENDLSFSGNSNQSAWNIFQIHSTGIMPNDYNERAPKQTSKKQKRMKKQKHK